MTKLLATAAILIAFATPTFAAEQFSFEKRAIGLARIGIHATLCKTPQSVLTLKAFNMLLNKGPKIPKTITQAAIEETLDDVKSEGAVSWCRDTTALFEAASH
jgi:hypothetical protein